MNIEKVIMTLFGGYMLNSALSTINLNELSKPNVFSLIIKLFICIGIMGFINYKNIKNGKIFTFLLLCLFTVRTVLNVPYMAENKEINSTFILCVLSIFLIGTYWYMKDEINNTLIKIKVNNVKLYIIFIGIFLTLFISIVGIARYRSYNNATFDFGIFTQMFECMKQTGKMNTTVEKQLLMSHLGRHFSLIFYIVLPIYMLFPHPETLQIIQGIMVSLPLVPIYLLCKQFKINDKITIAISSLYALFPATIGGTMHDIHENCFLTFFLLMLIWTIETDKKLLSVIMLFLTLSIKEDVAIYVIALGLYYILSKRKMKKGIMLIIVSGIWFVFAMGMIKYFGMNTAMDINNGLFENLMYDKNGGLFQIIWSFLDNPAYMLIQLGSGGKEKIEYLVYMIFPVALLIFNEKKNYNRYVLFIPFILMNVMTSYEYLHSIKFQYNFGTIAFIIFVIILNVQEHSKKETVNKMVISLLISLVLFVGLTVPYMNEYVPKWLLNTAKIEQIDNVIKQVPEDVSVTASGLLIPHLSKNLQLYDIEYVKDIDTDYVIIDERGNKKYNLTNYEKINEVKGLISVYKKI